MLNLNNFCCFKPAANHTANIQKRWDKKLSRVEQELLRSESKALSQVLGVFVERLGLIGNPDPKDAEEAAHVLMGLRQLDTLPACLFQGLTELRKQNLTVNNLFTQVAANKPGEGSKQYLRKDLAKVLDKLLATHKWFCSESRDKTIGKLEFLKTKIDELAQANSLSGHNEGMMGRHSYSAPNLFRRDRGPSNFFSKPDYCLESDDDRSTSENSSCESNTKLPDSTKKNKGSNPQLQKVISGQAFTRVLVQQSSITQQAKPNLIPIPTNEEDPGYETDKDKDKDQSQKRVITGAILTATGKSGRGLKKLIVNFNDYLHQIKVEINEILGDFKENEYLFNEIKFKEITSRIEVFANLIEALLAKQNNNETDLAGLADIYSNYIDGLKKMLDEKVKLLNKDILNLNAESSSTSAKQISVASVRQRSLKELQQRIEEHKRLSLKETNQLNALQKKKRKLEEIKQENNKLELQIKERSNKIDSYAEEENQVLQIKNMLLQRNRSELAKLEAGIAGIEVDLKSILQRRDQAVMYIEGIRKSLPIRQERSNLNKEIIDKYQKFNIGLSKIQLGFTNYLNGLRLNPESSRLLAGDLVSLIFRINI